ncbi:MAG: hypothetical protein J4O02_05750, partial [Chloroflexi bacterium]|nr:hypothetical protein [Chloroflexota bacterium]
MAVAVACSSAPPPAAAPGISSAELQAALQQAVESVPSGPSAAEIQALVQQAVEGAVPEGTSASEISAMVTAAVTAASSGAVTAGDIQSVVSKAISDAARDAPEPLTESQVAAIVSAAVMAIPPPLPVVVAAAPTAGTNVTPDYWNPPTAFYGQPLYGGEMIVNFEDPLEHANTWGAYTATVTRLRTPTMNSLVGEDPYNPGKIIPDLASSWEQDADGQGLTF